MQGQSHGEWKDRLQPAVLLPGGTTALTLENKPKPIDGLGLMPFLPFLSPLHPFLQTVQREDMSSVLTTHAIVLRNRAEVR